MGEEEKKSTKVLLQQLRELTGIPNDADIIRNALEFHLANFQEKQRLLERMQPILRQVEALGELDDSFDLKKFRDEMWGDT